MREEREWDEHQIGDDEEQWCERQPADGEIGIACEQREPGSASKKPCAPQREWMEHEWSWESGGGGVDVSC